MKDRLLQILQRSTNDEQFTKISKEEDDARINEFVTYLKDYDYRPLKQDVVRFEGELNGLFVEEALTEEILFSMWRDVTLGEKELASYQKGIKCLLKRSVSDGSLDSINFFIEAGVDPNIPCLLGNLISDATRCLKNPILTEVIKLLHSLGTDIHYAYNGFTPLGYAVFHNSLDGIKCLINLKANVNAADKCDGDSPLHRAAVAGNIGTVELLLSFGASLYTRNSEGDSPKESLVRRILKNQERPKIFGSNKHFIKIVELLDKLELIDRIEGRLLVPCYYARSAADLPPIIPIDDTRELLEKPEPQASIELADQSEAQPAVMMGSAYFAIGTVSVFYPPQSTPLDDARDLSGLDE